MKNLLKSSGRLGASMALAAAAVAPTVSMAQTTLYDSLTPVMNSGNYYGQCLGFDCNTNTIGLFSSFVPSVGAKMLSVGDVITLASTETILTKVSYGIYFDVGFSGTVSFDATLQLYKSPTEGLASIGLGNVTASISSPITNPYGFMYQVDVTLPVGVDLTNFFVSQTPSGTPPFNRTLAYTLTLTNTGASTNQVDGFGVGLVDQTVDTFAGDVDDATWTQSVIGDAACSNAGSTNCLNYSLSPSNSFTTAIKFQGITSAVPETSTYLMMLLGLAATGFVASAKQRRSK